MTSWDGFLVDLAEHLAFSIEKMLTDKYTNTPKIAHHLILQELRAKLLPLLEAGQAMRDRRAVTFQLTPARSYFDDVWDAAEASLKEAGDANTRR